MIADRTEKSFQPRNISTAVSVLRVSRAPWRSDVVVVVVVMVVVVVVVVVVVMVVVVVVVVKIIERLWKACQPKPATRRTAPMV